MRLMYYSANWQLLEERIDRSWTSGFTEDERAQTFWGNRYIDDAVARRRDRNVDGTYDDKFFYVTDAQFSTVAMVNATNSRVVERVTYDSYGKARHHFGADVNGDGASTSADLTAITSAYGKSIGATGYAAELDLNRDGNINSTDHGVALALSGGAAQSALASGMVSFATTGSGGSTVHGPDNPIAWDGYVFNAESSQYLVRFRWYDPSLGRWLEREPLGYSGGMNLNEYSVSAPPMFQDPSGLGYVCLGLCGSASVMAGIGPGATGPTPFGLGISFSGACYGCAGWGSKGLMVTRCCSVTATVMSGMGAYASLSVGPNVILNFFSHRQAPVEGPSYSWGAGGGAMIPGVGINWELTVDVDVSSGDVTITLPKFGFGGGVYIAVRVSGSCTACGSYANIGRKINACLNSIAQTVSNAISQLTNGTLAEPGDKVIIPGTGSLSEDAIPADSVFINSQDESAACCENNR